MPRVNSTEDIGKRVREARKAQGLTQEALAGYCGVGLRFLRELEAGKPSCQLHKVMDVLAGLGLAVSISSLTSEAFDETD